LALTATATPDVQADIQLQLKMKLPALFKQSFARHNIFYEIRYSEDKSNDTLQTVDNRTAIIYCRSRKLTDTLRGFLQKAGVRATAYHAGMSKEKREEAQQDWMTNKAATMVATTAFGMGIDKGDVRTVLHCDAPEHIEAYYQEAGRAGRDGAPAKAVLFYNTGDIGRLRDSTALQYPDQTYLRQVYQAVVEYLQIPIGTEPDQYYDFDLAEFGKNFKLVPMQAIYALKLLEQEGLWTLSESVYHPATIQFLSDRNVLDRLAHAHPDLAYLTVGLSRMYNTIYHYPTPIREAAISWQLKIPKDELVPKLERLARMGIIAYNKPGEGPQLFFHHYRVDSRYLIIDLKRIERLRKRHEARTEAMIAFLENKTLCRERMVLTYFGEQTEKNCGHCDICRGTLQSVNIEEIRRDLMLQYSGKGSRPVPEVVSSFPLWIRADVLSVLRVLVDSGQAIFEDGNIRIV
jgi:ATP-dependent DNA helicase RecQ